MTEQTNNFKPFRTVIFADSVLAQPVFQALAQGRWIVGLCSTPSTKANDDLHLTANLYNIPVFEADKQNVKDSLLDWMKNLAPELLITFTFPYLLPPEILCVPPLGAFNLHTGKLPVYRGPQPVFWQIANGEKEGAVTLHRMAEKFDTGAILASHTIPIAPADTYGLHCVQTAFAAVKLVEFLIGALMQYGTNIPTLAQDETIARYQKRPTAEDLIIRWEEQSGEQIRALVKACNPWNQGAFTAIRGIGLRLTDVALLTGEGDPSQPPGTILTADAIEGIKVNCLNGSALQLEVISMDEGILPGKTLAALGFQAGEKFITLTQ